MIQIHLGTGAASLVFLNIPSLTVHGVTMRNLFLLFVGSLTVFAQVVAGSGRPYTPPSSSDQEILPAQKYLIVDTHIDIPGMLLEKWRDLSVRNTTTNFDYVRAKQGGLVVAFMSIYVPSDMEGTGKAKPRAKTMIGLVRKMVSTWPDKFDLVTSTQDVHERYGSGKILLAMGMENGSPIEGDLSNVRYFFDLGIRYITLAHAKWNHIADGSYDTVRHWNGISPFGVKVVREMNRLGIMVDISHITDSAAFQVLRVSSAPVIASHSSCRYFTPGFERNISDDLIKAVAAHGGVVQIAFGSDFIDNAARLANTPLWDAYDERIRKEHLEHGSKEAEAFKLKYWKEHPRLYATVAQVAAHIDHVARLVGVDYVGLGSDFDGVGDSLPVGLKDVSQYPNLIAELKKLGYSDADLQKICGGNLLRVWSEVERAARSSK